MIIIFTCRVDGIDGVGAAVKVWRLPRAFLAEGVEGGEAGDEGGIAARVEVVFVEAVGRQPLLARVEEGVGGTVGPWGAVGVVIGALLDAPCRIGYGHVIALMVGDVIVRASEFGQHGDGEGVGDLSDVGRCFQQPGVHGFHNQRVGCEVTAGKARNAPLAVLADHPVAGVAPG